MDIQIDQIPVSQLQSRYNVKRSTVYSRLSSLGIQTIQIGRRSYITQAQLDRLDALDEHLKAGGIVAEFLTRQSDESSDYASTQPMAQSSIPVQPIKPSRPMGRSKDSDQMGIVLEGLAQLATQSKSAGQTEIQKLSERLMFLEDAARYSWILPKEDLEIVLEARISTENFERYGFRFCRQETTDDSSEWRVTKLQPST